MPRNVIRSSSNDEISVTVRGRTFEELKRAAIAEAADYFGVDRDVADLITIGSLAKPVIVDTNGRAVMYKGTVRVRWVTEASIGSFPAGPEADEDADED